MIKRLISGYKLLILALILMLPGLEGYAVTRTSTATGGTWSVGTTWVGGTAPAAGDDVIIATTGTGVVTVNATTTCNSLVINSGAILTLNRNFSVTTTTAITGRINFASSSTTSRSMTFTGDLTLNSGAVWNELAVGNGANDTFNFGGNFTNNATTFNGVGTGVHTFSGAAKTLSGSTITSIGALTVTGSSTNVGTLTARTSLTGAGTLTNGNGTTGTLNIGGTATITTLTATAANNLVNYTGAAQTAKVTTYNNLTLSGSAAKTFATTPTVNGVLSMEGTATVVVTTGVVTYGANATLQYNSATARTASSEEWIPIFVASGGIVIKNTGAITTPGIVQIGNNTSVPLNINSGATLTPGANLITLEGDFINSGTLTSGAGGVTIAGTVATQSIGGFTTTGSVLLSKTSGTATLQGNVNGGPLTISGSGATLNLGTALTHTFTGVVTLTAGTLNGGSSILNENAVSTTAWNGTGSVFSAGTGTVNFGAAGAQTVSSTATSFNNLTVSGSGIKTFSVTPTVNGILSLEGTATVTVTGAGVITYGSNATLQYNTTTARTATTKEWITPFIASGGIIIKNTGAITTPGVVQIGNNSSVPLNINSGATLTPGANLITLEGDFTTAGTLTSGSGGITIAGTVASQSIGGFTTTGVVTLTKTFGTATLLANVNGGALTINGSGGTLNLGAGLAHTFTGDVTLTAGSLNGGSSALTENNVSTTAWNGTGSVYTPASGTINFGGSGNQTIAANSTFYNLSFAGSGTKTFSYPTTINANIAISGSAVADLGSITTHTCGSLTLGGVVEATGSWGSNGSTAVNKNNTYFLSTSTGILNVNCVAPVAPVSGGNQTICANQTIPALSVTVGGGQTAYWYTQASGGALLASASLTYTPVAAGTFYAGARTVSTGCVSASRTAVTLTINTTPTALLLTGSSICSSPGGNGTITSTTSQTGITYQLYNGSNAAVQSPVSGTGSGLSWSSLPAGTGYYVIETNTTSGCTSTSSAVNISAYINPIPLVLTGDTICTTPGSNGALTSSSSEVGVNYQLYDGSDNPVQSALAGTGIGLEWPNIDAGTGYYAIGINSTTSCVSTASNAVNVLTFSNPSAILLTGSTICASPGGNGTISSTTSVIGINYQLYDNTNLEVQTPIAGTGSGLTWTGLAANTGYYVISSDNINSCSSSNSIAVDVATFANPTITVGGTVTALCYSSVAQTTSMPYSATTNSPTSYNIVWSAAAHTAGLADQGSTTFAFVSGGGSLTGIIVPAGTTAGGPYTGTMTITNANGCSTTQAITLNINSLPGISFTVQPGLSTCVGTTATYTTQSSMTNYVWGFPGILNTDYSLISGGTSTSNTATLNYLTTGSKSVTINYTNGNGCSAVLATSSTLTTVTPATFITVQPSTGTQTQCLNGTFTPITVTASGTGTLTYQWYSNTSASNTGGTSLGSANGAQTNSYTPQATTAGTLYYYCIVTGTCGSATSLVSGAFLVNALPTITTTSPGTQCGSNTVTLSATALTGTINWYAAATGGTSLGSGPTFTTPSIASTTTYYADVTSSGCTSAARTPVVATIIPVASLTVGGGGTFCSGTNITLTSTGTNVSNQYWTGPNSFYSALANPVLSSATSAMNGTYKIWASGVSGANLVSNGNFEGGNSGFTSNYGYVTPSSSALVPEGLYTVVANPNSVHASFVACGDHTTGTGLQMVVNGAITAGVNIWSQTVNVAPNSNYQFTYWIQSVVATNPSQLQLFINGVAAGPIYTADLATCSWEQFLYNWNSGSSTTAILSLVNMNTVANGNDFTLDDIIFQQICPATSTRGSSGGGSGGGSTSGSIAYTDSVVVTVNAVVIAGAIGTSQSICNGATPVALTSTTAGTGSGTISYEWQTNASGSYVTISGATAATYSPPALTATTSYQRRTVSVSGGVTCYSPYTTAVTITVSGPVANAGGPNTLCQSVTPSALTLAGAVVSGGASTGAWSILSGGGSLSSTAQTGSPQNITYTPAANYSGSVTLRLTTNTVGSCAGISTRTITINPAATASAGSAFSTCSSTGAVNITTGSTATNYSVIAWTSNGTGTFSNANSLTTATYTPSVADNTAGSVTITLTATGNSPCGNAISTKTLTITKLPVATFSYAGTPYCSNSANPSPTFSGGGVAGTFSSTTGLNFVSTSTGQINLATSTPGTYNVTNTIAAAGGCGVVTSTSSITITTLPVTTFSYTGSPYCSNATNPTPTYSSGGVAGTFSSTTGLNFVSTSSGQVNLVTSTPGTYTVTNTIAASGGCSSSVSTSSITINAQTVLSTQSTGAQTQCIGGTFGAITVTASGTALTYQWYSNITASTIGGISLATANGAQTGSYIPQSLTAGTLYYYCVVTGTCGTVTSAVSGAFIVNLATAINSQSTATQTQCNSGAFTPITVNAVGAGLTYQWFSNTTASTTGGTSLLAANGAQTSSYTPQTAIAGTLYYYCVVTGTCGTATSAVSGAFIVNSGVAISSQSMATQSQCIAGTFAPITVTATGAGIAYQWYSNTTATTTGGSSLLAVNGAQTNSYTPQSSAAGTLYYYCVVTGTCGTITSSVSGAFIVNPTTAISGQSTATQTQCITGTFTPITVTAAGVGLSYQWFSNTTATTTGGTSLLAANGAQTNSYTPQATVAGTLYYYCIVTGTCGTATSSASGAFIVNPATAISSQSTATQTQCIAGTFTPITVTTTGLGITYQWYSNTTATTSGGTSLLAANGAQTNSYTPQATSAATLYYYCIVTGTCGTVTSSVSGAFIVNPATAISSQSTATQTRCIAGTFTPITVTAVGAGLTYQWFSNTTASTTGGTSLLAANGAQTSSYTPQTAIAGTLYYYCVVTGTCGTATSAVSGAFIVNSGVAISGQSTATQTQCISGTFTPITVTATGAGITYQWFSNTTATTTGGSSLLAVNGAQTNSYTPQSSAAGTLYYYCVITGTCGTITSSVSGAIVVNPTTAISGQSTATQTQCITGTFTPITVTAAGVGLSYQWFSNTTATTTGGTSLLAANGAQTNSYTPQATVAGTLYYYCIVTGTCGTATSSASGAFIVNPATAISSQSMVTQTQCITGTFSPITVTATGVGLSYQWYSNISATTTGGTSLLAANGAQTNSYTPQATAAGTLYYYCIVTGSCGTVTSSVSGAFVVNPTTSITSQSTATQTQCIAGTFTPITVTAVGVGLGYQWYSNTTATTSGGVSLLAANGAQTNSYTPQAAVAGTLYYYCIVTGTCGTATSTVSGAFIVNSGVAISSQSTATQTQCITGTFTPITVTATGTGITYQWYSNTTATNTGGSSLLAANGAQTSSYTPQAAAAGTLYYYCIVTGTCGAVTSAVSGAIIVNPTTAISSQSTATQTQCITGTFTPITVTAAGVGLTYQWFSNTSSTTTGGTSLLAANGAQTNSYTPQATVAGTLYYYCVVTGTCGTATSSASGAFIVNPATAISSQSTATQTQCIAGTFTPITVTATGVGLSYQWYRNTTAATSGGTSLLVANGAQTNSYTPQAVAAGTLYYYCIVTGTCGTATSSVSGAFVVNPTTAISSQSTATQTQCIAGIFTPITVTATGVGLSYQWFSNTTASTTGGASLLAGNGAQTSSYTPQAVVVGTLYYYCIVTGTCGTATSAVSGAFIVNPATAISSQSTAAQTQCITGTFTPITVTASGVGLSYQWYRNTTSSTTGGTSLVTANGAQTNSYTPQTTAAGTLYYYCIVTGTCGIVTSTISGAFVVNLATAINSQSTATQTQCISESFTPISVTAVGTSLTYQWYRNTTASATGGTSLLAVNGAQTSSYTPQATVVGTLYFYCVVTGTCGIVTSSVSGAFIVNPATVISAQSTSAQTQCITGSFTPMTVTATGTGTLAYQWFSNSTASNTGGSSLGSANGAQTSSYTPQATTAGTHYYYCVVTGACTTVTSTVSGAFIVNPATALTSQSTATQSTCLNVAFTPITVTATGTGVLTYQWYSNTTASATGGTSLGSLNGGQTSSYSPQATTAGTLYYYCIVHGGCGSDVTTAVSGAFTVIADLTWTGAISTDWNTIGNWSCPFLPDLTKNVLIPNVTNKPILSSGATGACKNLVINGSSSLTVIGNILQIAESISNSGTFTASSGTIEMKGIAAQIIPSSTFAGNTILNLTVTNSSGVTLGGPLNITAIVKVSSGNLSSGGNLTLISSAAQTALIDGTGSGNVLGNVTMQRYLPSAFGYRYFSSPFQSATVNEFANDLSLSAAFPSFYKYDEDNHRDSLGVAAYSSGWVTYTATTGSLIPLMGYAANFGAATPAKTADMTGVVNNGALSISLYNHNRTYTKGFNLVGNPYPSPIDWNASSGWTKSSIDNALYFFNPGNTDQYTGVYSSYVGGVSTGNGSNLIASMQGFFIHVSDGSYPVSGTLGMTNAVRTNDLAPTFREAIIDPRTILRFRANLETPNAIEDVSVLYFDDLADHTFNKELDALKMLNTDPLVPNIYTISQDARQLSIKGIPTPTDSTTRIPLGVMTLSDGWVTFNANDISQLPASLFIYLVDSEKGVTQDLKKMPQYRFYLRSGTYNQRFSLIFSLSELNQTTGGVEKMFKITYSASILRVTMNLPFNAKGNLFVTNMNGQVILRRSVTDQETVEINPAVSTGLYIVTVISGNRQSSDKILMRKNYE